METIADPVDRWPSAADQRPEDDVALARRFARGDDGAFEAVVERHQARVNRLAYRLLGWSSDADDVVQEVFLSALKNAARFRGRAGLATWLTTITLNKCRTHRRGFLARLRLAARVGASPARREAPPADVAAAEADSLSEVQSALRRLAPRDREVIVLHYLEETPVDEIAAVLAVTRGAVEVRLHRARARLRRLLGVTAEDRP